MTDIGNKTFENNDNKLYHENKTENDTETENENETETETENETISHILNPLTISNNSELYVVSVDGQPKLYVKNEQLAKEKMWYIARELSGHKFLAGYRTEFIKIGDNELHLLGNYRFFIMSYDIVLHRIQYSKINECL